MPRAYLVGALVLVVLFGAGVAVLAVAGDSDLLIGLGLGAMLLAAVLLTTLFFYAVGRSEDRDRAAQRRARPPR
ncbi:MAG: hypothetical protein QOF12_265 [Solirubrobacteraceae bacterium]|nr:hypothetical protein [Solirubrobacteraceae bacterium]